MRPYGASSDDAAAEALAETLWPRVKDTINGTSRLEKAPVMFPLCAVAATIWAAMQHRKMGKGRKRRVYHREALEACLSALALGNDHMDTLRRIVLRTDPRHIHVDITGTPERWRAPEWRGSLGVFAEDHQGHLVGTHDLGKTGIDPPILHSLIAEEPL